MGEAVTLPSTALPWWLYRVAGTVPRKRVARQATPFRHRNLPRGWRGWWAFVLQYPAYAKSGRAKMAT